MPVIILYTLTTASKRESIVLKHGASILACNVVAVLLICFESGQWTLLTTTFLLLTVARQPVIYTRFLFHPELKIRKPQVENKVKNLGVKIVVKVIGCIKFFGFEVQLP